ncbi:hypothetical protein KFL_000710020 [Klebsormidium nitens]|uniref:Uncharacterized protein n=1 Tax=Klebsormidium nitens TaxID=105231 RepID=A0A1Y1HX34_KLENI|nr:hypothetical protein KFL_000710020 [Klebsormidium nitens]|eukprot:GAQ81097.1 hypothetical protein KFL_000710020 [Klebsormidium nitens]
MDNNKRRLPTLDSPSPYKPPWTPGGFSAGGATPPVEDGASPAAASVEDEPKTEEEWLARVAQDAAKRKELLEQVRNQLGTWYERVRSMRILQKAGELSAEEVADEARLVGLDSTRLMVAGSVYDSLTDLDPEVLSQFGGPDGPVVLYELRTLSVAQRGPVAEYIVANGLDVDGAREVVKAVKDHERRPEGREGFTEAPGDTLAFWYFRMAGETREPDKRARLVEKAAAVAESESAKERVAESS